MSLTRVFLLLWCISGPRLLRMHSKEAPPLILGWACVLRGQRVIQQGCFVAFGPQELVEHVSRAYPRLRELLVFYMSVSSWDCFPVKPNLNRTIVDSLIMRLPERPPFFSSPPLFSHLSLDTVIFILQLVFLPLNLKVFMGGKTRAKMDTKNWL